MSTLGGFSNWTKIICPYFSALFKIKIAIGVAIKLVSRRKKRIITSKKSHLMLNRGVRIVRTKNSEKAIKGSKRTTPSIRSMPHNCTIIINPELCISL